MSEHFVADVESIPDGKHVIVNVEGRNIGIYRIKDEFFALYNRCPHEGAQLCKGRVCGTTLPSRVYDYEFGREGEILRCPMHGWEFDIKTGKSLFSERVRTRTYKVNIKEGKVWISL
ncbi:Rieske (2Fe-2S) protein [Bacillus sp. JJ1533]|uniref:Rieske (2Fe-2S) protein n=1 Tax=Bacillus sp. JJ1533 TaxID=3122959 RepID=UPI003000E391